MILAEVAAGHPSRYIMPGSEVDGPDDDVRLPAAAVVVVLPTVRLRLPCSHEIKVNEDHCSAVSIPISGWRHCV